MFDERAGGGRIDCELVTSEIGFVAENANEHNTLYCGSGRFFDGHEGANGGGGAKIVVLCIMPSSVRGNKYDQDAYAIPFSNENSR